VPVAHNHTKRLLARGELAIGIGVRQVQSVEIGLMAKAAGFDFMFIDREHSTIEMSRVGEICAAALGQGITPIVRVPGPEPHHCVPLFDCGAQGIVVPHVQTAADARRLVDTQKLPPIGSRSLSRSSVLTGYETMDYEVFSSLGNQEEMAIALIEDREGLRNIGEIASVPHLDAIMIGASDLCADLGMPGKFSDPAAVEACAKIIATCAAKAMPCGIAGVRNDELLSHYIKLGARMIHAGTDAPILVEALKRRSDAVKKIWSDVHQVRRGRQ
jgi:2-keto-3-deoxy-L-rhamnonate aldolase RhmA